jgi:predicted aspartyl protease
MDTTLKAQLETANKFYREGQFVSAEQIYVELHKLEPQNTSVLARLGEIALLKNQPQEAEHYFKTALHHDSWLEKRFPFSTQLNASLALTYYRQNRFQEAAQFYKKAAGFVTVAPFKSLKSLGAQLALFDNCLPYVIEGAETTRIPFTLTDPLPVVQVSINGSEPLPFFIDTGGAEVIIDKALAAKVGAAHAGTLQGAGGGTQGNIGLGKVDSVTLGDITLNNVPVHIMDTQPFASVFDGMPVQGVIGTCLLMHFLATIDYINGCLILRRKTAAQIETKTAKVIPFWLAQTHYMVAYGTVNGKSPMLFFVDTGLAGKGFSAPEATLQEAGIVPDWSKAGKGVAAFGVSDTVDIMVDRLTLGTGSNEIVAHNINGVIFKKPFGILGHTLGFWIGGVVSHQFFRSYALTLDFAQMKLILQE